MCSTRCTANPLPFIRIHPLIDATFLCYWYKWYRCSQIKCTGCRASICYIIYYIVGLTITKAKMPSRKRNKGKERRATKIERRVSKKDHLGRIGRCEGKKTIKFSMTMDSVWCIAQCWMALYALICMCYCLYKQDKKRYVTSLANKYIIIVIHKLYTSVTLFCSAILVA